MWKRINRRKQLRSRLAKQIDRLACAAVRSDGVIPEKDMGAALFDQAVHERLQVPCGSLASLSFDEFEVRFRWLEVWFFGGGDFVIGIASSVVPLVLSRFVEAPVLVKVATGSQRSQA